MEDRLLLQRFVQDHSQEAFALLTARYASLVYAVCRRELGDADAAEDVTQAVFLILARKAPSLGRNVVLSGWLFQTARFAAKNARLTAQRRAAYEQKAAEAVMEQQTEIEDEHWAEIEPLLNQSLTALKAVERECVLLRFFQGASFAEVGASLGLSEDAARKRVTRSLEKMRQFFTKNGVIIPAIALPVLLTAHAAKAAPAACQANIAKLISSVLAGRTTAALTGSYAYQLSEGTLKAMKLVQLKVAAGITITALIGLSSYTATRAVNMTAPHPAAVSRAAAKPGHILQQVPSRVLTAAEIVAHCRIAYGALHSYQVTSTVTVHLLTGPIKRVADEHASASIQFVRSGRIHVAGTNTFGEPFAYVSDSAATVETANVTEGSWKKLAGMKNIDPSGVTFAIGTVDGSAMGAATTVPALLIDTDPNVAYMCVGVPVALSKIYPSWVGKSAQWEVKERSIGDHVCYVLTLRSSMMGGTESLWVDEKTFLLRRYVTESPINYDVQTFTDERINQPIPDSTFALPAVQ